jgi:hypothetical protein
MCPDTQTQNRHGSITNDRNRTPEPCIYQVCSLTRCPQEPSIHRASFTHFTLVLQSIHTCQGREHSHTKRRVQTSAVRSATTHKPEHQSQYYVHDSLLQLLRANCITSGSTVFQVRFWSRSCVWSCVQTQTQNRHGSITNDRNLTRASCVARLQSNNISTRALYTPTIFHTLHTRLGIDSHMSREGTLTY